MRAPFEVPERCLPLGGRAARERAYWDNAYRQDSPHHTGSLWTKHIEAVSYIAARFYSLAGKFKQANVLCLGGGIDRLGISLAKAGNRVTSVDVSLMAAEATATLARQEGVADNLTSVVGAAEELAFERGAFDAVVCKRSLHHMNIPQAVARVHDVLAEGGVLLAEEPICLARWLLWIHKHFPFAPGADRTPDERELIPDDFGLLRRTFREVEVSYYDCLSRESLAYFLCKAGADRLLYPLGKFDYFVVNCCLPLLRYLSTYAIIQARR